MSIETFKTILGETSLTDEQLEVLLERAVRKALNHFFWKSDDNPTDEEKENYRYQIIEKVQALCDANWYYKEVMYFVDEYDINAGKWIYKVWFMVENQSNGELVMIDCQLPSLSFCFSRFVLGF